MAENPTPTELGFAEFVAKLVSEMFGALTTAQFDQEKQLVELAEAALLSTREFAERHIGDEPVDAELERLFPGDSADRPTAVYAGAPYQPAGKDIEESPAIEATIGVRLARGDYGRGKDKKFVLRRAGVGKIAAAVRERLAVDQQSVLARLVERGIPRVIAEAGKINAKLTYEVLSSEQASEPSRARALAAPLDSLSRINAVSKAPELSRFHLVVRQADERAPQTSKLKVNVFGEVEITFKTVT